MKLNDIVWRTVQFGWGNKEYGIVFSKKVGQGFTILIIDPRTGERVGLADYSVSWEVIADGDQFNNYKERILWIRTHSRLAT